MNKLVTVADAPVALLSDKIDTSITTFIVNTTTGFISSGHLAVGTIGAREIVSYNGITDRTFTGITRSNEPRSFPIGTKVNQIMWMPVMTAGTTVATTAELGSITKTSIGLDNVDNTSDAQKPVSTATQLALGLKADTAALDAKQNALVSGTTIKTVNGASILGAGNIAVAGGSAAWGEITGVLASQTDLQTAFNAKANTASLGTLATQNGTFSGASSGTNTGDNATNTQYSGLAASKQDTLVSGTNIKTINGSTVLGSGNIVVSGSAPVFTVVTKDVGVGRSGTFDITGLSGLTADKPVTVMQTSDPITSKGNARDEPEMDMIQAVGYALDTTSIRVTWNSPSIVVGEYNFGYMV